MLVLTRKTNEEIVIGDNIRVTIVEVGPGRVKIGIAAPKSVRVDRAEIHEKKLSEANPPAAQVPPTVNRIAAALPPQPDAPTVVPPPAAERPANRLRSVPPRPTNKPR